MRSSKNFHRSKITENKIPCRLEIFDRKYAIDLYSKINQIKAFYLFFNPPYCLYVYLKQMPSMYLILVTILMSMSRNYITVT